MQNIQERLTGLWPATGASSRRTARFAVSISASLTAGLMTSVEIGMAKKHLELFNARKSTNQVTKYYISSNSSSCVHVCLNFALYRMIKYVVLKFI